MRALRTLWTLVATLLPFSVGAAPASDAERAEQIQAMYTAYALAFPEVESIGAVELAAQLASATPPVVVDVRPEIERAVSMLPGAIGFEVFEAEPPEPGRRVVVYCTIGARSGAYASTLRKQGLDVRNFEGSILAWTHAGGALVDAAGESTKRVHVYGKRWNLVADGYEGVITDSSGTLIEL